VALSHKVACDTCEITNGTRYDEIAGWYDQFVGGGSRGSYRFAGETLLALLGHGPGRCLDLACGGGVHIPRLLNARWTVVGVDESAEQLHIARMRLGDQTELVEANVHDLPFENGSFDAIAAAFVHTDVEDIERMLAEAARVLRAEGLFVHVGTHPCFVGPSAELVEGRRVLHPGYRSEEWTRHGPGIGAGIRHRVGVHHVTLARFLNAIAGAGLVIERTEEPGTDDPPTLFAVKARKPG
jgi:ubiquinone/menaquinone biosynthesis C-methylase UbiE